MITVLIVDDHSIARRSLRLALSDEDDIECVAEAESFGGARYEAAASQPDVVLLDAVLPDVSGIQALRGICDVAPHAGVVVLSMEDDRVYVDEAFAAGALGYLLKHEATDDLATAVREVAAGRTYVQPKLQPVAARSRGLSVGRIR